MALIINFSVLIIHDSVLHSSHFTLKFRTIFASSVIRDIHSHRPMYKALAEFSWKMELDFRRLPDYIYACINSILIFASPERQSFKIKKTKYMSEGVVFFLDFSREIRGLGKAKEEVAIVLCEKRMAYNVWHITDLLCAEKKVKK